MADSGAVPAPRRRRPGTGASIALILAMVAVAGVVLWFLFWANEDELLVIAPPATAILEGREVAVVGVVREFSFEEGLGDEDDFLDWDDRQVLVATRIEPLVGDDPQDPGVELEDVIQDEELVGRRVTVVGEIAGRIGLRAFVLED